MDKTFTDAMQKRLYDMAGFWKYMIRAEQPDEWVIATAIQRMEKDVATLKEKSTELGLTLISVAI